MTITPIAFTRDNLSSNPKTVTLDNLPASPNFIVTCISTANPTKKTRINYKNDSIAIKTSKSYLECASPEIILTIMKFLPNFCDLHSLVSTSTLFNLLFRSNQYGVCEAIARTQFADTWADTNNFLQQVGKLRTHDGHDHQKCINSPSLGIFDGGEKIGITEASRLLKFSKRMKEWKELATTYIFMNHHPEYTHPNTSTPTPKKGPITPIESARLDRALIRYYLLTLACQPDWIEERTKYHLMFLEYNLFSEVIDTHEEAERKRMSREEIIDRKRRHANPWVQYQGQDLRDMYVVCRATLGCWSQMPGTMDHGADHGYERWTNIDDACVQQEAELHVKRMCMVEGMCQLELLSPSIFFKKST